MKIICNRCGDKMTKSEVIDSGVRYFCHGCKNMAIVNGSDVFYYYSEPTEEDYETSGCAACGNPMYPDCLDSCPMGE